MSIYNPLALGHIVARGRTCTGKPTATASRGPRANLLDRYGLREAGKRSRGERGSGGTITITHPTVPVASVLDVPVIPSDLLRGFHEMERTSRPRRHHPAVDITFVARPAPFGPHGVGHVGVDVVHEFVHGGRFRVETEHVVFSLPSVDPFQRVIGLSLNHGQQRTVADRAIGTEKQHVVGHISDGGAEITSGVLCPQILQICAILIDDGETRTKGDIETRGAYQNVQVGMGAGWSYHACFGDAADPTQTDLHVGFCQRFEVVDVGSEAATAG